MQGVNKTLFIGNLGKDPETKFFESGKQLTTFSIAVSKSWTKDREKREKTTWINIACWEKTAELANQMLKKGSRVWIEGELENQDWEKNGEKRISTQIVCNSFLILDDKPQSTVDNQTNDEWLEDYSREDAF